MNYGNGGSGHLHSLRLPLSLMRPVIFSLPKGPRGRLIRKGCGYVDSGNKAMQGMVWYCILFWTDFDSSGTLGGGRDQLSLDT